MSKGKRMTAREKKSLAESRERLRAAGIIPPKKKPVNRKKFIAQVLADKDTVDDLYMLYMLEVPEAIACMIAGYDVIGATPEMMGAAKVLRLAIDSQNFKKAKLEAGETSYTYDEYFEKVVNPIIKL